MRAYNTTSGLIDLDNVVDELSQQQANELDLSADALDLDFGWLDLSDTIDME